MHVQAGPPQFQAHTVSVPWDQGLRWGLGRSPWVLGRTVGSARACPGLRELLLDSGIGAGQKQPAWGDPDYSGTPRTYPVLGLAPCIPHSSWEEQAEAGGQVA